MTTPTSEATVPTRMGLVLAASSTGTVFEWYDFFIFGSLASIIAKHFFASAGATQGYIFALLTFAAGFAVRPLGALVFGYVGDRTGRKRAFLVTVTIMGIATFAMGLLPDTKVIGPSAPYLLLAMRVLQGFAVGGEYGGAAIYVAEHASREKRGLATGWIQVSATVGLFLALSVILVARTLLGEAAFGVWGWRIPFLVSIVLLGVSLWIRLHLGESPLFRRLREEGRTSRAPLREAFGQWKNLRLVLIVLFALLMGQGVVWYTAQFYTQFFLERVAKVEPRIVNLLILTITAVSAPLHMAFARLSDFVGRKPVMMFGLGLAAISLLPGFQWLTEAVNPALTHAAAVAPVSVVANPADCSVQFDPIGGTKFVSSCDIAKRTLADAGVPYRNEDASVGTLARVRIGPRGLQSFDGSRLSPAQLIAARARFERDLKSELAAAGYPRSARANEIDVPRALLLLLIFIVAAAALYGPQAAALVELFPTRIRYSALSLPYHVGVGWFGGFLPATAFAIVADTGNIYAGLWYPTIVAAIGFVVSFFFLPETRGHDISN
jgi:MFS family permease